MGDVLTKETLRVLLDTPQPCEPEDFEAIERIMAHDTALRTALAAAEKENERLTEERISASAACADEMIRCEGLILERDAALKERDEARRMYCCAKSRACPHVVAAETWPADADRLFPADGEVKP